MVWFWSILIKFRSTSIYDFPCLSNVKIAASFTLFPSGVAAFGVTFSTPTKDFGTLHVHSILRLSTPQLRCFLLTRKKKREQVALLSGYAHISLLQLIIWPLLIITDYMMTHVTIGHWFEQLNCFICLLWAKEVLLVLFGKPIISLQHKNVELSEN